jgi:delta14-sterol reductase
MYIGFLAWIVVCAKYLPGKDVLGQPLAGGKPRVMYRLNGLLLAVLTWVMFYVGGFVLGLFRPTIIYENMAPLSTTVLITVVLLSVYLFVSGSLNGKGERTGTGVAAFVHDFWAGVELNPSMFGIDVKFASLKIALVGWILINMSFAAEQLRVNGGKLSDGMILYQFFSLVYSVDYYYNESAMLSTWDIISEHYGFMLIFGNYWWMWFAFCVQGWYLVHDNTRIAPAIQIAIVTFFFVGYYIFRTSNSQKNSFKTDPNALIWGKKPETIGNGRILVSGWWGILRKANYTGDWMIAIALAMPCGYSHIFAHFYPIYLISLNIHRAIRDDRKCAAKYGQVWVDYKKRVPYAVIPGVI